ncbi:hypothetical protein XCR1_1980007 [Xenorhabdus cabanillasii JM26]|uniref:Insertion element IS1 protein InsA helix-turn-helix domain-containing protein n=1 Tax=Xenorhabdus cabanillasii JM26 TaxID=1427517 RepID=W1J1F9_9GAMM|nr:hypothetical protein XCR1_1980007 [Xenorhabdus cabanillasii JM26]
MKERIIDMAMNNSGVRDTARVLKVGINTVIRTLKSMVPLLFATLILMNGWLA